MARSRLASFLLALVLASSGALLVVAAPQPASAAGCAQYEVIAARGSGQKYGASPEVNETFRYLTIRATATGRSVNTAGAELTATEYPAVSVWPGDPGSLADRTISAWNAVRAKLGGGAYKSSVQRGMASTKTRLNDLRKRCGSAARAILVGYSQGAEVMHRVLEDTAVNDLVAASILYGDPHFDPSDPHASGSFDPGRNGALGHDTIATPGKVITVCHDQDPICQGVQLQAKKLWDEGTVLDISFSFEEHFNYPDEAPHAVNKVTRELGWGSPPSGPGAGGPLDLVFAIDTTGSMEDDIDNVRAAMSDITGRLQHVSSSWRVAVVDYKDEPDDETDYQAQTDLDFTDDQNAIQDAIAGLYAQGGGDYPESVYSGVMQGLALDWRPAAAKSVLVMGDAPAKDPEPITDYTLGDVVRAARDVGAGVGARRASVDGADDNPSASVYTVTTGDDQEAVDSLTELADETSGQAYVAPEAEDASQVVTSAVTASGAGVVVRPGGPYVAAAGADLTVSGADSANASGSIVSYSWDFGDGESSSESESPMATHTYFDSGDYTIRLTVTSDSGLQTTAASVVHVVDEPLEPPAAPSALRASPTPDGAVTLSWNSDPDYWGTVLGYGIYSASGDLVAVVDGDVTSTKVRGLPLGRAADLTVRAATVAGLSEPSSATRVVPRVATSMQIGRPRTTTTGGRVTVSGRLVAGHGASAGNQVVTIFQHPHGTRAWRTFRSIRTDAHGGWRTVMPAAVTTDLVAKYRGDAARRGASSRHVVLAVRARVSASASKQIKAGAKLTVTARVAPRVAKLRVVLQQRSGGRWRVVARSGCNAISRCLLRLKTKKAGKVTLRVAVPADSRTTGGVSKPFTTKVKRR